MASTSDTDKFVHVMFVCIINIASGVHFLWTDALQRLALQEHCVNGSAVLNF